jgi:prepilin-type N-terminal cleavage/methylation domain-containing protein
VKVFLLKKGSLGFTLVEFLVVLAIITLITGIIASVFVSFRNQQALGKDVEMVIEVLRQARSQTLTSQNSSQYGVHFSSSGVTLFTGASYSAGNVTNQNYFLTSSDTIVTINLAGGGSNLVFQRLSGETSQNGSVVLTSLATSKTKTVTIYKTGLIESN